MTMKPVSAVTKRSGSLLLPAAVDRQDLTGQVGGRMHQLMDDLGYLFCSTEATGGDFFLQSG